MIRSTQRWREIKPASHRRLANAGIRSLDDAREIGIAEPWMPLCSRGYNALVDLAWALAGTLLDRDARDVPETLRLEIRANIGTIQ